MVSTILLAVLLCAGPVEGEKVSADSHSTLARAQTAVEEGRFETAQALIAQDSGSNDASLREALAVQSEIMRRIRYDYSLDRDAILAKLKQPIPDVTLADVDRWTQQGNLQNRVIDGDTYYFRREPSNLFRFCPEARKRAGLDSKKTDAETDDDRFSLKRHVSELVAKSATSDQPSIHPVHHRVRYALTVPAGHPRVRKGAKVRCWLPFPQEYRQQDRVRLISYSEDFKKLAPNGSPQRTAYFEQTVESDGESLEYWIEMEFVTAAYCPDLRDEMAKPLDSASAPGREYVLPRPPHIVFDDEIKNLASSIVEGESNPLARARRVFHWVDKNIRYCSEMEYSTIPSIAKKALKSRRGDCGVQALAFITLCRAAGVPARWQSGWETLPGQWNMHDWAEFYVEPWGWLPADPSYGLLDHPNPKVREFYFGHLDPYRMIVNLDYARPLVPPKQSFRSEPNDFQRGEIEIDGVNLYFNEWDWTFDVTTENAADESDAVQVDPRNADTVGMHRRIKRIARTIWPDGDLPTERAEWFCDLFLRLALTNHSLVYLDAGVQSEGRSVILTGATSVAHLRNLLPSALAAVGAGDVDNRIRVLPDRETLGERLYGACVAPHALTWRSPYIPNAPECDTEKPGEQSELLLGEPVFLLDRRDGCYLLHGSDGYWSWVAESAIEPMDAGQFDRYCQAGVRAVMTSDVDVDGVAIPRGAVVRVDASDSDAIHLIHPTGRTLDLPRAAVLLIGAESTGGEQLVRSAKSFLDMPYVFGGRSPEGLDCSGLVNNVLGQYGLRVARDAWQQAFDGELVATAWHRNGVRAGDQLLFVDLSGKVYHTGIAIDENTVLHAAPPAVRISSLIPDDPAYEHRLNRDYFMAKRRSGLMDSNALARQSE